MFHKAEGRFGRSARAQSAQNQRRAAAMITSSTPAGGLRPAIRLQIAGPSLRGRLMRAHATNTPLDSRTSGLRQSEGGGRLAENLKLVCPKASPDITRRMRVGGQRPLM